MFTVATRRALVLGRASALRGTVRVLPRVCVSHEVVVVSSAGAGAARPMTVSALLGASATGKTAKKAPAKAGSGKKPTAAKKTAKPKAKKVVKKKKPAAKKKKPAAKKKRSVKKVRARKPKKPVLTEEQKARRELLKLRKMALLKGPTLLPATAWTLYVANNVRKGDGRVTDIVTRLASSFKNLSEGEKRHYTQTAEANKAANEKTRQEYFKSFPVEVIYLANRARRRLAKKMDKTRTYLIHDDRLPDRALSGYTLFIKNTYNHHEHGSAIETLKGMAQKWKSMSEQEKAPYQNRAAAEVEKSTALLKSLQQKGRAYWKEHE